MLPKIDVPIYELNLISSGKKIRFRPFLVKEQKLLLMANQSDDPKESLNVVKQICKNCIISLRLRDFISTICTCVGSLI